MEARALAARRDGGAERRPEHHFLQRGYLSLREQRAVAHGPH